MKSIILQLQQNQEVFKGLLSNLSVEEQQWRPSLKKWSMLEVVCHLHDEERDDFRFRTKFALENPGKTPPPIDPEAWVLSRNYAEKVYKTELNRFLRERKISLEWLQQLEAPKWESYLSHESLGKLSALHFLNNWLAHDYLHIRQILRYKFEFLRAKGGRLDYAGNW